MKITFNEKKLKVEPDIRDYAEKKISKLDRFLRNETEASVTFSEERGRKRAEVTLHNSGMYYRGSETSTDFHYCIDTACSNIERQIRRNKTRLEKRLHEGSLAELEPIPQSAEEPEEEDDFKIVRTKRFSIKPMTPEEAILQMELLDHEFFVFRNEDANAEFTVVYRRKDGGYGLISDSD